MQEGNAQTEGAQVMDYSERVQRIREAGCFDESDIDRTDSLLAKRISALLNHSQINENCMVDAYYYDFSVIPRGIQEKNNLWRDCYLIFGITIEGELVSKWIYRRDLDSDDPIVDGKVIHSDKPSDSKMPPEIRQYFDSALLSTPMPDLAKMLGGK